jgi:hypothetical protein
VLVVVIFSLAVSCLGIDTCQDDSHKIENCKVQYHTCIHYNPGKEYQTEAKVDDCCSAKSDWHGNPDNAVNEATYKLFDGMDSHSYSRQDCNCDTNDINEDTCQLRIAVCFYFESTSAVKNKKTLYRGHAYDADYNNHDREGKADGCEDPTQCANDAVADLFKKYPETAANCQNMAPESMLNATQSLEKRFHSRFLL